MKEKIAILMGIIVLISIFSGCINEQGDDGPEGPGNNDPNDPVNPCGHTEYITPIDCELIGIQKRDGLPENIIDGSWIHSSDTHCLRFDGGPGKTGKLKFTFENPICFNEIKIGAFGDGHSGLRITRVDARDASYEEVASGGVLMIFGTEIQYLRYPYDIKNAKYVTISFSVPGLATIPGFYEIAFK